jgi:hypothetical protein
MTTSETTTPITMSTTVQSKWDRIDATIVSIPAGISGCHRRDRKKVEMLFAHLKRILRLGRLRLRGPSGAQFEFTLAAIAQNLRRLAKLVARPPPITSAACVA